MVAHRWNRPLLALIGLVLVAQGIGCSSTGIAVRERLGYAKREQLVDRVEQTRDAQAGARDQFETTLDELKSLTGYEDRELEGAYSRLSKELDRSEKRAKRVRDKIRSVERVGTALFKEWESELELYSTESLRRASEEQLDATRARYERVVVAMRRAESKMEPVLAAFRDQTLFLKHNLNARAIASIDGALVELEGEIAQLIADMESSIDEANRFIDQMSAGSGAGGSG